MVNRHSEARLSSLSISSLVIVFLQIPRQHSREKCQQAFQFQHSTVPWLAERSAFLGVADNTVEPLRVTNSSDSPHTRAEPILQVTVEMDRKGFHSQLSVAKTLSALRKLRKTERSHGTIGGKAGKLE